MPQTCSSFLCALVLAIAGSMTLAACGEAIPGFNDVASEESTRIGAVRLEGTAVLNHPHIVTLHSIEEQDGLLFPTMVG